MGLEVNAVLYLYILIVSGFAIFTLHLLYVKAKCIPMADKRKGLPGHDLYKKVYSDRFLAISIISTLLFSITLLDFVFGRLPFVVAMPLLIARFLASVVVVYLVFTLFQRK